MQVQRQESPLVKVMQVGWPKAAQVEEEQSGGLQGQMENGKHTHFQARWLSSCVMKA